TFTKAHCLSFLLLLFLRCAAAGYFISTDCKWNVIVPQNNLACICTGICRGSSVYQIQMCPRFFTMPSSATGSTLTVLKVPAGVLISSLASTFMLTVTVRIESASGNATDWPTTMGCDAA